MNSDATNEKPPSRLNIFAYQYDRAGKAPVYFGLLFMIPFLVGFILWSMLAPLNAAAIADGNVILNDNRKTVQHLEGGIIEKLFVEEGGAVKKGDPILTIRDIPQRAQVDTLKDQILTTRALVTRLAAERDEQEMPEFTGLGKGLKLSREKLNAAIKLQNRLFLTRRESITSKIGLIKAQAEQAKNEISGQEAQLNAANKQLSLLTQEHEGAESLIENGFITLTRKLELEKEMAELEGRIGGYVAGIARLKQSILASELQIHELKTEHRKAVLDELQKIELSLREMTHQLVSVMDQLKRTVVQAPASGRIMDLQFHTQGAVVAPGDKILDIVPEDDRLIIEAKLLPNDIDLVRPGSKAKVLLSAYKAKKAPKLDGEVATISGDILSNEMTGEKYFLARLVVNESVLKKLKADVSLYPGMPVQVFFIEGERTLADYLFSPIIDAAYRAFREE